MPCAGSSAVRSTLAKLPLHGSSADCRGQPPRYLSMWPKLCHHREWYCDCEECVIAVSSTAAVKTARKHVRHFTPYLHKHYVVIPTQALCVHWLCVLPKGHVPTQQVASTNERLAVIEYMIVISAITQQRTEIFNLHTLCRTIMRTSEGRFDCTEVLCCETVGA